MPTESPPTAGAKFAADLSTLLRARNGLIWLVTREEARAERLIVEAATAAGYEPRSWDCSEGWRDLAGREISPGPMPDPGAALAAVRDARTRAVFIMRDLAAFLTDPYTIRGLRSVAKALTRRPREEAGTIIVLGPRAEIPPELQGAAVLMELPLPDRAEIAAVLDSVLSTLPDDLRRTIAPNGTADAAVDAAVGLSESQAQANFQKSIVQTHSLDVSAIHSEKKRAIAGTKGLEWLDPIPAGLSAIGGLGNIKAWLLTRKTAFSPAARRYGLKPPRGVLLVGEPGNGKSLTAKCIGTAWSLPVLRGDLGGTKSKWVGESESQIRSMFKAAAAVAPCILWLDEIEKALGGASSGAADGGVSSDALGTILGFLQDGPPGVFVCATANDVSALPPELLRKGRFDEIFAVLSPVLAERTEILAASLAANGRTESLDLAAVAGATDGFSGAELAALVPDALFTAFADGARPLETRDLLTAARSTVPLSRTAPEKIQAIRKWCAERARPASSATSQPSPVTAPRLDL